MNASQVPSAGTSRGLVAAALAHPSAIPENQSRVECVDMTELKQLMDTFATWCPCSDVRKISVLLYGIIYQGKPSTASEAGKCLELVESSIKTMGIAGLEWFKQRYPAYSRLKKMRNESSHATMVPEPDYNEVIRLLTTVLSSYHEHYFVSEFDQCALAVLRPFRERNCHDPKCPKREECLKQQQEYLRPSTSCVAASAKDYDQIICDEENRRERLAKEPPSYCVKNGVGYDFCRRDGKSLDEVCREAGDELREIDQPAVCYAHDGKFDDLCWGCSGPDSCPDCSGPGGMDFNGKTNWMFKFGRKRWELLYGWRSDIPQEEDPGRWDELVKKYDEQQRMQRRWRNEKLAKSLEAAHLPYDQDPEGWRERSVVEGHMVVLRKRIEACTCKKHMHELVKQLNLILDHAKNMRKQTPAMVETLVNAWNDQLSRVAV